MILFGGLPWLSALLAFLSFLSGATGSRPQQAALENDPILVDQLVVSQPAPVIVSKAAQRTADACEPGVILQARQVPAASSSSAAPTSGSDDVVVTVVATSEVPPVIVETPSPQTTAQAAPSFDPSRGTSSSTPTSSFGKRSQIVSNAQSSDSPSEFEFWSDPKPRDVYIDLDLPAGSGPSISDPSISVTTVTATPTTLMPLPTDNSWWSSYWSYRSASESAASLHTADPPFFNIAPTNQSLSNITSTSSHQPQPTTAMPMIININIFGDEDETIHVTSNSTPNMYQNIAAPVVNLIQHNASTSLATTPQPPLVPGITTTSSSVLVNTNTSVSYQYTPLTSSTSTSTPSMNTSVSYQYTPLTSSTNTSTSIYTPPPNTTSAATYQYSPLTSNSTTRTKTVMVVVTKNGTSFIGNGTTTNMISSTPPVFINEPPRSTHTMVIVLTVTNSSLPPIHTTAGAAVSTSETPAAARFFNYDSSSVSSSAVPPTATWDPNSHQNIAVYFGQAPNTAGSSIEEQCQDPHISIVILSYITEWDVNGSGYPQLDLGSNCPNQTEDQITKAPGLWKCDRLIPQITYCQSLGKKVLISIGGNSSGGTTEFDYSSQAESRANLMWNLFGPGNLGPNGPDLRPFGNISLDGFDVASVTPNTNYWGIFGTVLRNLFITDKSKTFLLTASPQCLRPDPAIPLDYIKMTDIVIVQSYQNNFCAFGLQGWDTNLLGWAHDVGWHDDGSYDLTVNNVAPPRVMVGAIAWNEDRQVGWINSSTPLLVENLARVKNIVGFGGICLWDGAQAQLAAVNEPVNYTEAAYLAFQGRLINGDFAPGVNATTFPSSLLNTTAGGTTNSSIISLAAPNDTTSVVSEAGTVSHIGTSKFKRRQYGMKKLYFRA